MRYGTGVPARVVDLPPRRAFGIEAPARRTQMARAVNGRAGAGIQQSQSRALGSETSRGSGFLPSTAPGYASTSVQAPLKPARTSTSVANLPTAFPERQSKPRKRS